MNDINYIKHVVMQRNILILGFGSIGSAVLPLILRHIDINKKQISIIAADSTNQHLAEQLDIHFECISITENNYKDLLKARLQPNDVVLNLAVHISSLDLILLCQELNVLYLDTSIERWYSDKHTAEDLYERRKNLILKTKSLISTALICNGANPGLVSHFVKQAVLDIAEKVSGIRPNIPQTQIEWSILAKQLNIVTIHIAERDTQISSIVRQPNEYVNTWSVTGLFDEALEYTNFSWGTHEESLPQHLIKKEEQTDSYRMVQLTKLGAETKVKSWLSSHGIYQGLVIPHAESFSLAEYFCYKDEVTQQHFHPTVHYVYQPCDDALVSLHDAVVNNQANLSNTRILQNDIVSGNDELGILILRKNSPDVYWLGSKLNIDEARTLITNNNATSLQVAIGVLAGLVHIIKNPEQGLIEAEQCDFIDALNISRPYLGDFGGHWGIWPDSSSYSWSFKELSVNII